MLIKLQDDLNAIAQFDPAMWEGLRGKRIFATGCTGFIGAWFIHSFLHVNKVLGLNASMTLLTRSGTQLLTKYPVIASDPAIVICEGDILNFPFPAKAFDLVIHGATEVAAFQAGVSPSGILDVAYLGTKRVIEFCHARQVQKVLFLSSGAAYGSMPQDLPLFREDYPGAPVVNEAKSSYGEAKRLCEIMLFNEQTFAAASARIFATSGPFLPMNSDFAFSNFMRDCLQGKDIEIKGNGKSTRSYLYAGDLILWLWSILLKGRDKQIYNVGSEEEVSISSLALQMKKVLNSKSEIKVLGTETSFARYVPSCAKAQKEFLLPTPQTLNDVILKTFEFYKGIL